MSEVHLVAGLRLGSLLKATNLTSTCGRVGVMGRVTGLQAFHFSKVLLTPGTASGQVCWRRQWKTIPFLPASLPGSSQPYFSLSCSPGRRATLPQPTGPCEPVGWNAETLQFPKSSSEAKSGKSAVCETVRSPPSHLTLLWREELSVVSGFRLFLLTERMVPKIEF